MRLGTSLRIKTAAQTLAVVQRLSLRLGVSKVFDATGLDCLGLPVFMSLRPTGLGTQIHSGKGLAVADAAVGAWMEAFEFAAAESASGTGIAVRWSLSRLVAQWPDGVGLIDFAPLFGASVHPAVRVAAVWCERLQTRHETLVPAELVLMPCPARVGPAIFGSSSNGLASGNTLEEATLHGLLEVLERDTAALHIARDETRLLSAATLPTPFDALSRRWRRLGIRLYVRWMPNAFGLPCFEAGLHDTRTPVAPLVLCRGWGLHFDREIALARAICEAAQSRLSIILAQRPDLPGGPEMARRMTALPASDKQDRLLARLGDPTRRVRFAQVPHEQPISVRSALRALLARLAAAGLGPVFRRRLLLSGGSADLRGLHAVRVVVVRSEAPIGEHPRMGPRLLARLQGA